MLTERILQAPFAWYKSELYQERHSKGCYLNQPPHLIAPNDRLLPFQIKIPKAGILTLQELHVTINCTDSILDLTENLMDLEIYDQDPLHYFVIYKGTQQMERSTTQGIQALDIPPGIYNAKLITSLGTYFSEMFCAKQDLSSYATFEWWSDCDMGDALSSSIIYSTGFKNRLYLDAIMLPPKVELEEEMEKNGYGVEMPVLQRFVHRYRIALPDLMHSTAIAVSTISMHPQNLLILPDGRSTTMQLVKADPQFQDCWAYVELEFQEAVVIKSACCS